MIMNVELSKNLLGENIGLFQGHIFPVTSMDSGPII